MIHLKIFEEFTDFAIKVIDVTALKNYNTVSSEGVFNNKIYQLLSFNCEKYGLRSRKMPYENPTVIKIISNDLSITTYFYLRTLEDNQIIICKASRNSREMYLEMGYSDFLQISKIPIVLFDKLSELFDKLERDKYITPIQRLG